MCELGLDRLGHLRHEAFAVVSARRDILARLGREALALAAATVATPAASSAPSAAAFAVAARLARHLRARRAIARLARLRRAVGVMLGRMSGEIRRPFRREGAALALLREALAALAALAAAATAPPAPPLAAVSLLLAGLVRRLLVLRGHGVLGFG